MLFAHCHHVHDVCLVDDYLIWQFIDHAREDIAADGSVMNNYAMDTVHIRDYEPPPTSLKEARDQVTQQLKTIKEKDVTIMESVGTGRSGEIHRGLLRMNNHSGHIALKSIVSAFLCSYNLPSKWIWSSMCHFRFLFCAQRL